MNRAQVHWTKNGHQHSLGITRFGESPQPTPRAKTRIANRRLILLIQQNRPYIGRWWKRLDAERVQCNLCPRHCQMKQGQRGFCFVRQGSEEGVVLTTYGRSSGFCIDPVEKKPLSHFYPGTSILSFGTAGCNLGCQFCQNWDISKAKEIDKLQDEATPENIASAAQRHGCTSVAFTYNDPVIFAEYAIDTAKECHKRGIKAVAVSAGFITDEARADFFEHMDATNIDLKGFTHQFYSKTCLGDLEPVLETLKYLVKTKKTWTEITTLLIPGHNDTQFEIERMTDWYLKELGPDVPLHFTAFHPDYRMVDIPRTPGETLQRARETAIRKGLKYVYTGNIPDPAGSSTYCPSCKECIILRIGYTILGYHVEGGACAFCRAPIAGVLPDKPGTWGSRRQTIHVGAAQS